MDADYGERLKFGFVMVSHPWLQYYATAASFALFGDTTWAARLPFAIAGLATILVAYFFVWRLSRSRPAATAAALMLASNVQFLLYARQARNYALNALLTCLLIWQLDGLRSRRRSALFAVTGILLFHAHPVGLVPVIAIGALILVFSELRARWRYYWPAALAIGLYSAPWLLVSRAGHAVNSDPATSPGEMAIRLAQFAGEYTSVTPALGVIALLMVLAWRRRRSPSAVPLMTAERHLLVAALLIVIGQGVLLATTHTAAVIWVLGLHHTVALIPLTMMAAAVVLARLCGHRPRLFALLVVVFCVTRLPQVAPWAVWAESTLPTSETDITLHIPERPVDRLLRTTQLHFVRSLVQPNEGVIADIAKFLNANAAPGDQVVTNYEWEPLYFHTGLPQAAKISPSFPIYSVAKASGLPDYVFSADRVRWIVWRRAWPAYFPEQDCGQLLQRLADAGVTTTLVATIRETLFENRENVNFRRYPGNRYVFPWYPEPPDVEIYRVDWESDLRARYLDAERLLAEHRYEEAATAAAAYLRSRPDDLDALTLLGVGLMASGRPAQGVDALRQVVAAAPESFAARRNLAQALFDTGDVGGAAEQARAARRLNPGDAAIANLLAQIEAMR